jgi:serine/threonine protein kinase
MIERGSLVAKRYLLGEVLGIGGMGVVYTADDLARRSQVAVKILHPEHLMGGVAAQHMRREARIGAGIAHPNVVRVLDSGDLADGTPYLVMERAEGRALNAVAVDARFSVHRIVAIVRKILAGLSAIHHAGFVHGDLKNDNVLVHVKAGGRDVVKIIDLGLACAQDCPRVVEADERLISGTPDYVAPELVAGARKSPGSDIYAVGVMLYELLTGSTPFAGGSSPEILRRQVEEAVLPPSLRTSGLAISLALEHVVMRALAKDPTERFRDVGTFAAALTAASATASSAPLEGPIREVARDGATEEWTRPALPSRPERFGGGTQPIPNMGLADPDPLIARTLENARAWIDEHRLAAGAEELERAVRVLAVDRCDVPGAWRLLLSLAAVYGGLGDHQRARRNARRALEIASRTGAVEGCRRATALLERLGGQGASS